jgi:hypothetical protein
LKFSVVHGCNELRADHSDDYHNYIF